MSECNALTRGGQSQWSLAAYKHILKTRLIRKPSLTLQSLAVKAWEIAPGEISMAPPAFFLPDQLERVTGWAGELFYPYEHPRRTMEGVGCVEHGPTRGYLLKDVWLIDGTLYKGTAKSSLSPRAGWLPKIRVENEIDRGAMYCTAGGNKWFGSWLMDDCITYPIACDEGVPVTTALSANLVSTVTTGILHAPGYEDLLGMTPVRLRNAFFRELVIFDDLCQNRHKHMRFRVMGEKLLSHVKICDHPGVFILRGGTGELRLLRNEIELAERLRERRGFRIIDPAKSDVPTIVAACAGARTVVGIEGSHLIHGVNVLRPGGSLLVLQPPNRFLCFFKYLTDRDHQNFGFVVGTPEGNGFSIDPDEVERTLDLFPS
ncbi:glycosyltransferase family 61 protein [Pseudomonas sp. AL03]|uniref:glycosyltransferase 61 family protein n=1 Tax=Pseudomonas sp. AL03 TaxID=3042230 RepID=UPI00249BBD90|nr:glycosyltransferase family 61 protein [Pseudomonas sp. AL03]MDI3271745.1 glycosyltransferase family 61 protein [Pseudomonas sp. AL03]